MHVPDVPISCILVKLDDYEHMGIKNVFVVRPAYDRQYFYSEGCLERMCGTIMAGHSQN